LDLITKVYERLRSERSDIVLIDKTTMGTLNLEKIYYSVLKDLGSIVLTGWLTEEQQIELYDLCDIYLGFSRGGGFEMNNLEALARGEVVIAPDEGSWTDYLPKWSLVRSHHCDYVLADNPIHIGKGVEINVDKAVKKILDIIDDLDEYKAKVREYVNEKIRHEYTWDVVGRGLKKVIDDVLSGTKA